MNKIDGVRQSIPQPTAHGGAGHKTYNNQYVIG